MIAPIERVEVIPLAIPHELADDLDGTVDTVVVRLAVAGIAAGRRLRRDAVVAVMQTADFWNGDDATG